MDAYYLVLLETSGNQPFIFGTNKLRENVGASQLIHECGTRIVLGVKELANQDLWHQELTEFRKNLRDPEKNLPIDKTSSAIEVVIATSGKAILAVKTDSLAKKIISEVTAKAIKEAPGVSLIGVSTDVNAEADLEGIERSFRRLYSLHERARGAVPGPDYRFLRLPVLDGCRTSGLPASLVMETSEEQPKSEGRHVALSIVSLRKREAAERAWERMSGLFRDQRGRSRLHDNLSEVEAALKTTQDESWLAVIHADGNGFGELFAKFAQSVRLSSETTPFRSYVEQLRNFSIGLEEAAERAFRAALEQEGKRTRGKLPVLPLVVGGDDVTVVCAGSLAVRLTRDFLLFFERETSLAGPQGRSETALERLGDDVSAEAAEPAQALRAVVRSTGLQSLSACAGLAIVKPHFPFHLAYNLADDLLISAKRFCRRVHRQSGGETLCSVIDFHVLHDSSDAHLGRIRERLRVDLRPDQEHRGPYYWQTLLHGGPYLLTLDETLIRRAANGHEWVIQHDWMKLDRLISEIKMARDDKGEKDLSGGLLHDLRQSLFLGREQADSRFKLQRTRYRNLNLFIVKTGNHVPAEETLFWDEPEDLAEMSDGGIKQVYRTSFLDILDLLEFLRDEEETT